MKNTSEQLPPPGFSTRPQLYFVFDSSVAHYNLPNASELSHQLKSHVEIFSSSDPAQLEAKIRDYNSRPSDMLLVAAQKSESSKMMSLIKHPQRSLSLLLLESPIDAPQAAATEENFILFNRQKVDATIASLVEIAAAAGIKDNAVGWRQISAPNPPAIWIYIDWKLWTEQVLQHLSKQNSYSAKSWKEISFSSNALKFGLNPTEKERVGVKLEVLEKALSEFRLSQLGS